MRYQEIIFEVRPATIADASQILRDHGYKRIGDGSWAQVFHKDGDPWVLKLFENEDTAYLWFIDYAKQHPSPHWPVFKSMPFRINAAYSAIRMEKLSEITEEGVIEGFLGYMRGYADADDNLVPVPLRQCADALSDAARRAGYMLDIEIRNLMWRGQTLVMADPVQLR